MTYTAKPPCFQGFQGFAGKNTGKIFPNTPSLDLFDNNVLVAILQALYEKRGRAITRPLFLMILYTLPVTS